MPITISDEQVEELLSPDEAFAAVKQAHLDLAAGKADNVVRTRSRVPTMSLHALSAASQSLNLAAAKVYSGSKNGSKATVLLYDTTNGDLIAIIEANRLGQRRTTAASAVAASVLTPKSVKTLGIIGTGWQAQGVLTAYTSASIGLNFEKIIVYSRDENKRNSFCEFATQQGVKVEAADSSRELCEASDVIVTATTSSKPVVEHDTLGNVKHISAIGSNSLARVEIPGRAITTASLVAVDTKEVAAREAGDLLSPLENGKIYWSQIAELGEILTTPPKLDSSGYTLFCSQGAAVQDLYAAKIVFEKVYKPSH